MSRQTLADDLRRAWAGARVVAAEVWARATRVRPSIQVADGEPGMALIAAAVMNHAPVWPGPGSVPVGHLLSDLYSGPASRSLFRPGPVPVHLDVEYGEWQRIWLEHARAAIGEQWDDIQAAHPPREALLGVGPIAAEWTVWRLAAYRAVAVALMDTLSRGEVADPQSWDLEGTARPGARLTLDTAAYRALLRFRDAAGRRDDAVRRAHVPDLVWLRAPWAIGRSRHELEVWPQARQQLGPDLDDAVVADDAEHLATLLRDTAQRLQALIAPHSPWHPDHHPIQDHHGPHSLSRHLRRLTDAAEPEWAGALRQAATWHAADWNSGTFDPIDRHALSVTALVVYVLAAGSRRPAAQVGVAEVLRALTVYRPFAAWLATALGESGHRASDPSDPPARLFAALTYDHPPPPGEEVLSDGTGWSGPMIMDGVARARTILGRHLGWQDAGMSDHKGRTDYRARYELADGWQTLAEQALTTRIWRPTPREQRIAEDVAMAAWAPGPGLPPHTEEELYLRIRRISRWVHIIRLAMGAGGWELQARPLPAENTPQERPVLADLLAAVHELAKIAESWRRDWDGGTGTSGEDAEISTLAQFPGLLEQLGEMETLLDNAFAGTGVLLTAVATGDVDY